MLSSIWIVIIVAFFSDISHDFVNKSLVYGLLYNNNSVQNLLLPFCCILKKDTLRHIPVLGGLGK